MTSKSSPDTVYTFHRLDDQLTIKDVDFGLSDHASQ